MFYSAYAVSFIIFINFLIPISNTNPFVDDNMLIAFVKGQQEMPISEYSKQKYEAHIGVLYFMKKNWKCDKIGKEFDEYERTECQKYRKYLVILHEYLYREYFGLPTVKPKFVLKERNEIEIEGPIIYAMYCLTKISHFYFNVSQMFDHNLNTLFNSNWILFVFQPKLLNEKRLNYEMKLENEPKMPINEMILQLAIDTANEWQTNEILEGIIRQNFEENLEEMFKKAEEKAKKDYPGSHNDINEDKHFIIIITQFNDSFNWINDCLFSEFVKGLATKFTNFYKLTKEYSCDEKEDLVQIFGARLGTVYFMIKNWHCDKIGEEFDEYERTECQKWRKYLHILYDYLFRVYVEGKNVELANKIPAVKPIFMEDRNCVRLSRVLRNIVEMAKYFFGKNKNNFIREMNLVNEKELNYEENEEKREENGEVSLIKGKKQKTEDFNDAVEIANLRREFELKMDKYANRKSWKLIIGN